MSVLFLIAYDCFQLQGNLFGCKFCQQVVTSKKLPLGSGEAFDAFDRLLQSEFLGNSVSLK